MIPLYKLDELLNEFEKLGSNRELSLSETSRMPQYDLFFHGLSACSDPLLGGIPTNLIIISYCRQLICKQFSVDCSNLLRLQEIISVLKVREECETL